MTVVDAMVDTRERAVARVVSRVWRDEEYLADLHDRPGEVLAEAGVTAVDGDEEWRVCVDTENVTHLLLTEGTTGADPVGDVVAYHLPLPPGHELRILQDRPGLRHFIIPVAPEDATADFNITFTGDDRAVMKGYTHVVNAAEVANIAVVVVIAFAVLS
jgi:hypothetical protein